MGKKCLKCGHERQGTEDAPEYECPSCGAIYAKVEAAQNRSNLEKAGTKDSEENTKEEKGLSQSARASLRSFASMALIVLVVSGLGLLWMTYQVNSLESSSPRTYSPSDVRAIEARGELAKQKARAARAEANLDKAKCREAAANKWLLDFTVSHTSPSYEQQLEATRNVAVFAKAIRVFCGDNKINGQINLAAKRGVVPEWIRAEVNALAASVGLRLRE